ncbi:MAG: hypothetical protein IPO47_14580 [Bacteroidetes bacterium]|nr:hypothetical protein [Bacteroidota bacterium]MBL0281017.1 hypothetical protein [Bacteroidota bacterium]
MVTKKPLIGVIAGLALYAILVITSALLDPSSFLMGLLFKVVIIIAFVKAIGYAKEVEALRKEMRTLYGNQDGLPIDLIS